MWYGYKKMYLFKMKILLKTLTLVLILSRLSSLYGQIAENDTVFIKKEVHFKKVEIDTIIIKGGIPPSQPKVLIGTTFLPYSNKMIGLLNKGLSPIKLEVIEECNGSITPKNFKDYPKFIKIVRNSNQLTIDVSIFANCCHNFLGEAEVIENDTLNLIYTSYGGFCSCNCCFTLRYKFNTSMEKNYQILKYVTINSSKKKGKIPNKH